MLLITGYFSCLCPCAVNETDSHISLISLHVSSLQSFFCMQHFSLHQLNLFQSSRLYPCLWSGLWYDVSNLTRSCESLQILLKILGSLMSVNLSIAIQLILIVIICMLSSVLSFFMPSCVTIIQFLTQNHCFSLQTSDN